MDKINIEGVLAKFKSYPVIPVFYSADKEYCLEVLEMTYLAGIRVFEFVNRGEEALVNFRAMKAFQKEFMPDLLLGVGTILNEDDVVKFAEAGADFLISPIVCDKIAAKAAELQLCWIPGCMTPTEIHKASTLDVKLVKLFPVEVLGIEFLNAVKPLFPKMSFMPTGGVKATTESVLLWKNAGVHAVGVGSALFTVTESEEKRSVVIERCQKLLNCMTQ